MPEVSLQLALTVFVLTVLVGTLLAVLYQYRAETIRLRREFAVSAELAARRPPPPIPAEVRNLIADKDDRIEWLVEMLTESLDNGERQNEAIQALFSELDIRPPADPLVRFIRDNGPTSMTDLVQAFGVSGREISGRLTDLSHRGVLRSYVNEIGLIWEFGRPEEQALPEFASDDVMAVGELMPELPELQTGD